MKKILIQFNAIILILIAITTTSKAADLLVVAGGAGGAYASISAALTAASPGDRIIVTPQANGAAFVEPTITITKSIQILSATEGAYFTVDGTINVTPATAAISVTIEGMRLLTGGIQSTIASPSGARSSINLLHDSLATGTISFNHDNYNLTCAGNYLNSGITMRFGKVLGNMIQGQIVINTDASTNNANDTVMIIGNKITLYTSANTGAISWSSTSQFFNIQNNFIYMTYPSNTVNYGIHSTTSKNSANGGNIVYNNTIWKPTYSMAYGIVLTTGANAFSDIQNNLIIGGIYNYSFYFAGGNYNSHYNYATSFSWYGITNDLTNTTATNTTVNTDGVITNALSNAINGGNPDAAFDDINSTRNDAGCYGGSFTMSNFLPISNSDWARVILLNAPRRVLVNGTININATGFDK